MAEASRASSILLVQEPSSLFAFRLCPKHRPASLMRRLTIVAVTWPISLTLILPSACRGLRAEWIPISSSSSSATARTTTPQPRRSGHVEFRYDRPFSVGDDLKISDVYVFGGYAEVDDGNDDPNQGSSNKKERFVVNDLWRWSAGGGSSSTSAMKGGWVPVHLHSSNDDGSALESTTLPRSRLVAAASVLGDYAYVVGGWDPGVPGTGGEILGSVYRLGPLPSLSASTEAAVEPNLKVDKAVDQRSRSALDDAKPTLSWTRLPDFPDGPTSRHVAVTVRTGGGSGSSSCKIVVHNHRCRDHVYVLDSKAASMEDPASCVFVKQPTTGVAPSPRGLHAATVLQNDQIVLFGGAARDGAMSNEVFVLDATTWTWTRPNAPGTKEVAVPCPRAAPCLVAFDDTTAILYGGAEATPQGLTPLGDVWAFDVKSGTWQRLSEGPDPPTPGDIPPPRNAATLTCISPSTDYSDRGYRDYVLAGGWHPFVQTWDDCYVLRIHRDK